VQADQSFGDIVVVRTTDIPGICNFPPRHRSIPDTWGDCTPTRSVLIEGRTHNVPQNLYDFFQAYFTHPWGSSHIQNLWIDQICINQLDLAERSKPVGIMNKIFWSARKVLIWPGCEPAMARAARQLLDNIGDTNDAIAILLRHPYFSRVWIVQEAARARKRVVICVQEG
jgi:hypothetical protein